MLAIPVSPRTLWRSQYDRRTQLGVECKHLLKASQLRLRARPKAFSFYLPSDNQEISRSAIRLCPRTRCGVLGHVGERTNLFLAQAFNDRTYVHVERVSLAQDLQAIYENVARPVMRAVRISSIYQTERILSEKTSVPMLMSTLMS